MKSISEGSAADLSGRIAINDRIVEVNGHGLQGFTNHEAVEVLRQTGDVVHLKLERYNYGQKYDQVNLVYRYLRMSSLMFMKESDGFP